MLSGILSIEQRDAEPLSSSPTYPRSEVLDLPRCKQTGITKAARGTVTGDVIMCRLKHRCTLQTYMSILVRAAETDLQVAIVEHSPARCAISVPSTLYLMIWNAVYEGRIISVGASHKRGYKYSIQC